MSEIASILTPATIMKLLTTILSLVAIGISLLTLRRVRLFKEQQELRARRMAEEGNSVYCEECAWRGVVIGLVGEKGTDNGLCPNCGSKAIRYQHGGMRYNTPPAPQPQQIARC